MPASLGRYDTGDLIRLRATFVSTDLVTPADPSSIIFNVLSPASPAASYAFGPASVTRAGTGAYYMDLTPDVYGDWYYKAVGTGGVQAVSEWSFQVRHSKFVL